MLSKFKLILNARPITAIETKIHAKSKAALKQKSNKINSRIKIKIQAKLITAIKRKYKYIKPISSIKTKIRTVSTM